MAYDGNQCKWSYLSTNLEGSLLLQIRGEACDPRPRGAEGLLRSKDIRKQEGGEMETMTCRGGRSKPEKQRQVEKSPRTPPDQTPAEVRVKKEERRRWQMKVQGSLQ